jgi:hypothetical protein
MPRNKKGDLKDPPAAVVLPPDANSIQILTDLIEYHVEMIILDEGKRYQNWDTLKYFWGLHPANQIQLGRLYLRIRLAELLRGASGVNPYDLLKQSVALSAEEAAATIADNRDYNLIYWDQDKWDELVEDLHQIEALLKRKDAQRVFETSNPDNIDAELITQGRDLVSPRVTTLRRLIEVQKALANIRSALEEQILDHNLASFVIDAVKVNEFGYVLVIFFVSTVLS